MPTASDDSLSVNSSLVPIGRKWGGGVDAQHILPRGTPTEVADNVRQNMKALMPGGGYVFNNVHNIQGEVPPENIVALFDTAYECGFYD